MRDEDVISALRRGEDVYGRTAIAFNGGANPAEDSGPTFEPSDLICSGVTVLICTRVTAAVPTVRAGTDVLVFYRKHNVTFGADRRPISHLDAPTVPLRVLPD